MYKYFIQKVNNKSIWHCSDNIYNIPIKFQTFYYLYKNIMQVVIRIIIILVAIFLIRLLKKWIKRIIFILILLVLAFFIYWIFSPSWAARLRYNVRTFPSRVTSWISSQSFLDYDNYKLSLPSVWDKIDLNIGDEDSQDIENSDIDENVEIDEVKTDQETINIDEEKSNSKDEESETDSAETIKSFPKSVDFVELPTVEHKTQSKNDNVVTWYSKSDILRIITKYIEDNLDDNTDILVNVEYDSETKDTQKITLQTQQKTHFSASISTGDKNWSIWNRENKVEEKSETQTHKNTQTYTKLSQKDIQDAQEVFSILF